MAFIRKSEARERLGVSMNTLDKLIREGKIPAYRIGSRAVRINDKDLDDYLESCRVKTAPPPEIRIKPAPVRRCEYVPGMKVV